MSVSRVLFITSEAGSKIAGDSQSAVNFAKELNSMELECALISCSVNRKGLENIDDISHYTLYNTGNIITKIFARFQLILYLIIYGLKYRYWIIYGKTLGNRLSIVMGLLLKRKIVFRSTLAGFDDIKTLTDHPLNKILFSNITGYWALNDWFVRKFHEVFNAKKLNIFKSPQGVNNIFKRITLEDKIRLQHKLGLTTDFPIIIMVGHIINRKGFPEIFDWFEKIQQDFQLVIVGAYKPHEKSRLYKHFEEMQANYTLGNSKFGDRIIFTGEVSNVYEYLQSADLYIHASYAEGFPPNALNEAMSCGLACIVRRIEGINRSYIERESALFFGTQEEFKAYVQNLLENRDLREFYANNAKRFASDFLNISIIAHKFIRYLDEL